MSFDSLFRNARVAGDDDRLVDIGIRDGRFAAIGVDLPENGPSEDLGGRLVFPGFVETHVHLDKSCLLGRCDCGAGTLREAVAAVAAAKRGFTVEDVERRASRTLEMAIAQGTQRIRTHVEVDPRVGLTSFKALRSLAGRYAWALDLELCVFPQEGLLDDEGCDAVLVDALEAGADVIGGAPYMDRDSHGQIARIFELARHHDLDIDFHLDFSLDVEALDLVEVCRQTEASGWQGRVAIGHVTKLSSLPPARFDEMARRLAGAGVAVTALPATDLFLMGRDVPFDVPRGVAPLHRLDAAGVLCSISTNNVLNPFTPFGDASLLRMANLFANVAQRGTPEAQARCFDMVSSLPARLLRQDYGIAVGQPADLVVLDAASRDDAVARIAQPLFGLKNGRRSFTRPLPALHRP